MKWLFFYAHPDDESVAAGGTIRMLVDRGDEVVVVFATDGSAGTIKNKKILKMSGEKFERLSVEEKRKVISKIRKEELEKACKILGVSKYEILDFTDGQITNELVWGEMTKNFTVLVEKYKPGVVVTFDHTGWYYHLDHVGVSLAVVKATQQSKHKIEVLLFNPFHPPGIKNKWKYHYPEKFSTTHAVNISRVIGKKAEACKAHISQGIGFISILEKRKMNEEWFSLIEATKKGKELLREIKFFKAVSGEQMLAENSFF